MNEPIVGLSGVLTPGSKLLAATRAAVSRTREGGEAPVVDLSGEIEGFRAARFRSVLPAAGLDLLRRVEQARALMLAVPLDRGTVPGLFTHVLDLMDREALAGKPVLVLVDRAAVDGQPAARLQVRLMVEAFGFAIVEDLVPVGRHDVGPEGVLIGPTAAILDEAVRRLGGDGPAAGADPLRRPPRRPMLAIAR